MATPDSPGKILLLDQLQERLTHAGAQGPRVVLANGAFDLLHVGHVRYLTDAACHGDLLVVAVNDDASVRRLKGEGRPVVPLAERMELLAALAVVDYVVAFSEDDVRQVIRTLRPAVHAKGTDYTTDSVPERDEIERLGGRVVICGDPKDHATTQLLARMKRP